MLQPVEVTVSTTAVGLVGGGRIARIVLAGWKRAGFAPSEIVVSDNDPGSLARLQAEFPRASVTQDNRQAARQDLVLFALHPPTFPAVLREIKDSLARNAVFVSLAPKWTMTRICSALGGFDRVARVIPNAPSIVNRGYNPVSFSKNLATEDRARVLALFAPLGTCPEVPEDTLEAYAIVAAMGPTYFWYQLYQLIDLGCGFGLTRGAATEAVSAMLDGALATMTGAGMTPDGVMDLVPVKPLEPIEQTVRQAYIDTLAALHKKLTA
jgi:pyrroline-5-carboxylate reductase